MDIETKKCARCSEEEPVEEFHVNKARKDGRQSSCKQCYKESYNYNKSYHQTYYQKNKEKLVKYQLEYNKEYQKEYRKRPHVRVYRLQAKRMRRLIKDAGKKKSLKTTKYLGCNVRELMSHLENQWSPGMSWDNYGTHGWHIDHIRPCASFDLSDEEQQKICFHYTNLQPLWAEDNLKKSKKWEEEQ